MFSSFLRSSSRRLSFTAYRPPTSFARRYLAVTAAMPKRKSVVQDVVVEQVVTATETPSRKSTRKKPTKAKVAVEEPTWDPYGNSSSPLTSPEPSPSPAKTTPRKRRKKANEPVVYDIPPIASPKTTTFKGRLGYACLNTILRAADPPVFCSRTCRIATLKEKGLDYAKELALQNVRDLKKMVEWNEENGIRFMRISSEMFPFASHKEWGYDLAFAEKELREAGDTAKRLGHRLTTHPGQFTQLASPKDNVVEASIRELDYHCQMMRYMGLGKDSVIILHMGGVYGDKPTTIARFREVYTTQLTDEMRERLVLENDEMCYNPDDLLPICEELNIPIVLDYHHNYIYPSKSPLSDLIPRINETWTRKGIRVKQHLSEPRPGLWYNDWKVPVAVEGLPDATATTDVAAPVDSADTQDNGPDVEADVKPEEAIEEKPQKRANVMELRAHADRCTALPDEVVLMGMDGDEGGGDLMIEAKDKEQAVFQLYRIYNLKEVKYENLRPEKAAKGKGKGAGEDGDGDDACASPAKRTPRRSPKKAKTEPTDEDPSELTPSPAKKPRKARAKKAVGVDVEEVNQEDAPVPVDGAPLAVVEAEEHPEAVEAVRGGSETTRGKAKKKARKS